MAQKKITELQLISSVTDDLSIPGDDGIQSYRFTPPQLFAYIRNLLKPSDSELSNLQITFSVSGNAATIALKTNAAVDATAADPIRVGFRSATITSGAFVLRQITAALSTVISSGSTAGQVNAQPSRIYVYLIDSAGAAELAWSHKRFVEDALVSTTAEGGAGAADSASVMYSTTARSNVACRLIGYILNTQTTAGTWTATATKIQLSPFKEVASPTVTRVVTGGSGTYITPAGATRLRVTVVGQGGGGAGGGSSGGGSGTAGTASSFSVAGGSAILSAAGGSGGIYQSTGTGGTVTVNSPAIDIDSQAGGNGGTYKFIGVGNGNPVGGQGGSTPLGGGGQSAYGSNVGQSGTGGGGSGGHGGADGNTYSGTGGGGGGFVRAWINNPSASYDFIVGAAAGGGGSAGSGTGTPGGGAAGGSGQLVVEEFYD